MIVVTFFTLFFFAHAHNYTSCKRHCGDQIHVHYPFGFSDDCEIPLHCNQSKTMAIGDFQVKQVTTDNILLHFPPDCRRNINHSHQFIGPNYAPSPRNNFLIRNCAQPVNNCSIQPKSFQDRFSVKRCDGDVSCYSENNTSHVNELGTRTNCSVLFTSILINLNNSVDSVVLALEFELVELEWWLKGPCRCAKDAICVNVSVAGEIKGFRCRCKVGSEGDGYREGGGCRRG